MLGEAVVLVVSQSNASFVFVSNKYSHVHNLKVELTQIKMKFTVQKNELIHVNFWTSN